jgi:UDP-2,3-diacylglucosamine pyrophosphatase LpxH
MAGTLKLFVFPRSPRANANKGKSTFHQQRKLKVVMTDKFSERLSSYEQRIHTSLSRAKNQSLHKTKTLADLKLVVFSDHHRGGQDGADQFRLCKPAYHAALGYYLEAGFELLLLGDVEDLWQVRPEVVIESYRDTLKLETAFAEHGRYTRIWGNHDNLWQDQDAVQKYLQPYLAGATPFEAVRLTLSHDNKTLGDLFFAHGHQGTGFSDRYARFSQSFVRYVFNPLQRFVKYPITTPAQNYELRYQHERAMFDWSRKQNTLILVTGHTHRPVFSSETHGQYLREELETLKTTLVRSPTERPVEVQERLYQKTAELHWVLAQTNGLDLELANDAAPCYFNTGCCSFSDGDITGLELEDGEIRLVRWPDGSNPWKRVLRRASLREVFSKLSQRT